MGYIFYSGKPFIAGFSSIRGCKPVFCALTSLAPNAGKPHNTVISVPKLQLRSFSSTQNVTYPTFCVNYMQPHGKSSKKPQTKNTVPRFSSAVCLYMPFNFRSVFQLEYDFLFAVNRHGIQKYGSTQYLSSSSSGGNTRTNAVMSVLDERSRPP